MRSSEKFRNQKSKDWN